ncbi:antibiotic biosynthesis monooxygenase [Streptomyces sp. NPDC050844]|uniref:putative quinol monooxygenase n=1 Tax=Streptomyces sp. NPDC050844 TaxID=3155790 RepID=UPI0033FBF513
MSFALVVRFIGKDEESAEAIDELVADALPDIRNEPGTLLYTNHSVVEQPESPSQKHVRVFYELYKDQAAHKAHVANVQKFLDALKPHLAASPEITFLDVQDSTSEEMPGA